MNSFTYTRAADVADAVRQGGVDNAKYLGGGTNLVDLMRENIESVARLLSSPATHIYVCGLKGMEDGVIEALRAAAEKHGLSWDSLWSRLKSEGRLHLETY